MGSGATKPQSEVIKSSTQNDENITLNSIPNNAFKESQAKLASSLPGIVISAKKLAAAKRRENADETKKILWQYPELADTLSSVREWTTEIKKNKDSDINQNIMKLETRRCVEEIYTIYFEWEEREHRKIMGDQLAKDHLGQTLTEYLIALSFEAKNTPTSGYKAECIELVRNVFWNYSDSSLDFCLELGRSGLFSYLVADLRTFYSDLSDGGIRSSIILPSISIIHNCAKHIDNKKYFKQADTVEAILPYSKIELQEEKMITMMTLAYLIEEKDNKLLSADDSMLKFILKYLKNAIQSPDHKFEGFTAEEILSGLMHLANNDDNKIKIVNEGILPLIVKLLQNGDDTEKATGAKTVWILSFSDQNKSKIREEKDMMSSLAKLNETQKGEAKNSANGALWVLENDKRLEKIRSSNISSLEDTSSFKTFTNKRGGKNRRGHKQSNQNEEVTVEKKKKRQTRTSTKKSKIKTQSEFFAAAQISSDEDEEHERMESNETDEQVELEEAEELDESGEEEDEGEEYDDTMKQTEDVIAEKSLSTPKHIMISYQWNCQKTMIRLKNRLEGMNYRVWIDVESMGGSTLQAMAEAVENSEVVLICMSQKYKDSPNCRTEAEYAYTLDKSLIPVRVEQGYEPDGWLGALQGAKFYFDFSNPTLFNKIYSKLIKELGERGKYNMDTMDGPLVPVRASPVLAVVRIPIEEWAKNEVAEWTKSNQITSRKIQQLDGSALVFLRYMKRTAPDFFFQYIFEKLGLTELSDMMTLCNGLDNLET